MPEMIPVGNTIVPQNPQQGLSNLSSILGIQQQRQQLQTGQYLQQTAQAGAQSQQEQMTERQRLQTQIQSGAFGDPNSDDYAGKVADWARGNLPLIGNDVAQAAIKTQSDKTSLRSSVADLQRKYRTGLGGIVSGFIGSNAAPGAIHNAIDEYVRENPDALETGHWVGNLLDITEKTQDPNAKAHQLATLASELKGEPQQEPGTVDLSGQVQPGAVSKYGLGFTPQGPALQKTLAPQVVTPPGGNPQVIGGGAGTSVPSQYPGPKPTDQDMQAFQAYQTNLNARVQSANRALPQLRLADEALNSINAGGGSATYAEIASKLQAVGAPKSLVDSVANGNLAQTQLAEKYLFQSALGTLMTSGGANTNDQVQRALTILPHVGTDPRASHELIQILSDQGKTDYAEQNALVEARQKGSFNPATWQNQWATQLRSGKATGVPASQIPSTNISSNRSMPTGGRLKAYADKYTGGDLGKAQEALKQHGYQ